MPIDIEQSPKNQESSNVFLAAALSYAARGWRVFPLSPASKKPMLNFKWNVEATTDATVISQWWSDSPRANVAIMTGDLPGLTPGPLVIDLDPRHHGIENFQKLAQANGGAEYTIVQRTGGDGLHLIYAMPKFSDGKTIKCSAGMMPLINGIEPTLDDKGRPKPGIPGIDVKGQGGYIVAPPSRHPDGPLYRWIEGRAPDEAGLIGPPLWLMKACLDASTATRVTPGGAVSPDVWCDLFVEGASAGSRDDKATKLYGYLVRKHSPILAYRILQLWNEYRCHPPLSKAELDKCASSIARKEMSKLECDNHE
jgi:hypothetical protein